MIEVNDVSKSFDGNIVLSNICLSVPQGSITCFLGPSGSGKTTLIRVITGIIKPDKGEVRANNFSMPDKHILPAIGFMPQNEAIYNDLTAIDNIYFFGRLYGIQKNNLKTKAEDVLNMVDLSADRNKLVKKFSYGMKKRLSLAIAILNNPEIILLDEPTSGIDPLLKRHIWQQLFKYRDNGCTIIVTTHIMDEALKCDSAVLIFEGKIIVYDKINNLLGKTKSGKIEELFIKAQELQRL
jgi:ABC-2 type transport system ATP-binding protein